MVNWDVGGVSRVKLEHVVGVEDCCDLSKLMTIPNFIAVARQFAKEFLQLSGYSTGVEDEGDAVEKEVKAVTDIYSLNLLAAWEFMKWGLGLRTV